MAEPAAPLTCWVVSDGRTGMENQALGLAEATARLRPLTITVKQIAVRAPFASLPRMLWGDPFKRLAAESASLDAPYPDLWIATGRLSIPYTLAMRRRTRGATFTVQTQAPRTSLRGFDLVIPPRHDEIEGDNVLAILGSPNRLTSERLTQDAAKLKSALPPGDGPLVAALIGGPSKAYRMSETRMAEIADALGALARDGARLMVTLSRRTPEDFWPKLTAALAGLPAFLWDGEPVAGLDNPYFGMLGLADHILVTEESANMIADAAFTGQPVHLMPLEGGAAKFRRFHADLENIGATRIFNGALESWTYRPLRETDRAAQEIVDRMAARATPR